MKRLLILIALILITAFLTYGKETWKIGFLDISHDGENVSDTISRAVKSSVSGFLKRDFTLVKITNNWQTLSKNEAYLIGLSNNIEFVILGYLTYQNQTINLTLELIDVANKLVKLSKYYNFNYDVDEVFNTIDTIVLDFTEGIKKAIPKYEEKMVIEYREKIKKQQIQLEIPGTFIPSIYINTYLMSQQGNTLISIYPEISLKYHTTRGGIFNNGWFIGLNSPLSPVGLNYLPNEVYKPEPFPKGININIYSGISIMSWLGIGIEILFRKEVLYLTIYGENNLSADFSATPVLKFSFGPVDIFVSSFLLNTDGFSSLITFQELKKRREIEKFALASTEIRILYGISKDLNAECKIGIDLLDLTLSEEQIESISTTSLILGISISKKFSF